MARPLCDTLKPEVPLHHPHAHRVTDRRERSEERHVVQNVLVRLARRRTPYRRRQRAGIRRRPARAGSESELTRPLLRTLLDVVHARFPVVCAIDFLRTTIEPQGYTQSIYRNKRNYLIYCSFIPTYL